MFEKRVVVDSNVYISAFVFGRIPREILEHAEAGRYNIVSSEPIRIEVEKVLREKFGWPREKIRRAAQPLWNIAQFVRPESKLQIIKRDPSDNKILECALASYAHFIVSGDVDLLDLNHYENIEIFNPRNFLNYLKLISK